jgi:hypothetical protein
MWVDEKGVMWTSWIDAMAYSYIKILSNTFAHIDICGDSTQRGRSNSELHSAQRYRRPFLLVEDSHHNLMGSISPS